MMDIHLLDIRFAFFLVKL